MTTTAHTPSAAEEGRREAWGLRHRAGDLRAAWRHLREEERASPIRHPRLWPKGFASCAWELYNLEDRPVRDHLSDAARVILQRRLGDPIQQKILSNKLAFHTFLSMGFSDHLPRLHGVIVSGRLHPWSGEGMDGTPVTLSSILEGAGAVIVKPLDGARGANVHVARLDVHGASLDGRPVSREAFDAFAASLHNHLVQERLQQHPYAEDIFPGATNTIRVVFVRDPLTGEVIIPAAAHRFGSSLSAPTDNFSRGGVASPIDLATGRLGLAASRGPSRPIVHDRHPETGGIIEGVVVPRFAQVLALVSRLGEALPFMNMIGWDLMLDHHGQLRIIEGNHSFGVRVLQVHTPLLENEPLRALCERYGVLGLTPLRDLFLPSRSS